jgi:hypothetical protein
MRETTHDEAQVSASLQIDASHLSRKEAAEKQQWNT